MDIIQSPVAARRPTIQRRLLRELSTCRHGRSRRIAMRLRNQLVLSDQVVNIDDEEQEDRQERQEREEEEE